MRVAGLPVDTHIHTKGPVAFFAGQLPLVGAFQPVAHQLLVVPLQIGRRARDGRVGGVEGVDLHIAIVAQRVIGIQRVLELQRIRHTPLRHRAQPLHAVLVQAVCAVVVLEPSRRVNVQRAASGLQHRGAPVGPVHVVLLVFIGQGVGETAPQVRQQRCGQLRGLCLGALGPAARVLVVDVDARKVRGGSAVFAARDAAVQADGDLFESVRTKSHLAFGKVAAFSRFGDVVDRAAHATRAKEKARCAANGLDTVVDPAVDSAGRAAVLRVHAVVELCYRVGGEPPIAGRHGARGVVRGHARDGSHDFLCVLCAAFVDGGAVHHGDRGRRFAGGQAQAAAGFGGGVEVEFAVAGGRRRDHVHAGEGGRGRVLCAAGQWCQHQGGQHAGAHGRKRVLRSV